MSGKNRARERERLGFTDMNYRTIKDVLIIYSDQRQDMDKDRNEKIIFTLNGMLKFIKKSNHLSSNDPIIQRRLGWLPLM